VNVRDYKMLCFYIWWVNNAHQIVEHYINLNSDLIIAYSSKTAHQRFRAIITQQMFLQIAKPDAPPFAPILTSWLAKITFGSVDENARYPLFQSTYITLSILVIHFHCPI
jgi:hypothetical protein